MTARQLTLIIAAVALIDLFFALYKFTEGETGRAIGHLIVALGLGAWAMFRRQRGA